VSITRVARKCGKTCRECELYQLCGGCSPLRSSNCLVNLCISRGLKIRGVTMSCEACVLASACVKSGSFSPPEADKLRELRSILESWSLEPPVVKLPRSIPEIPLEEPVRLRWDRLGVKAILVTFLNIKDGSIEKAKSEGVHRFLGFDGVILLSTIMPDELLNEETFKTTLGLIKEGGFDGVVGWDMPVYIDFPKAVNLVNLVSATLFTIRYVEEGVPTIPLLKGSDPREMETHSQWLKKLGFKRIGLHATEYILHYDEELARDLYGKALEEMIRMRAQPLVIGVMGPKSFPPLLYRRYVESSFAGMSWLLKAREFVAYHRMESLDLKNCVMECGCEACLGKSPNQVSRSIEDIAEHNLVQFKNFVEGRRESVINVFDAILEKGTMAVVGDLHIGTPQTLWEQCLSRLREIKPSYLVLLGDTFDLVDGKPSLWEVAGFFRGLSEMEAEVIPVLGCADSSQTRLFDALQDLSLSRKPLRPQLLKPNLIRALAIKNLLAFYAIAKEEVKVKLADGRIAMFEHGHGLGFSKTDSPEEIAKTLLDEKSPEEICIIGHYHKSFFNPERGIAMLGSWQTRTHRDRESGFIPDVTDILLVREDGSMELIRGT